MKLSRFGLEGFACLALAALFGCEGTVEPGSRGSGNQDGQASAPTPPTPAECAAGRVEPGASPLRRLTRAEYDNTVHDLLGDDTAPGQRFPNEEIGLGFANNADSQSVSGLLIEAYESAAIDLAAAATANIPAL